MATFFTAARLLHDLEQLGYVEGKNLIVDRYAADYRVERYPDIAREAVRSKPDVIFVGPSHELILQIGKATATIPIVAVMGDPVAAGIVHIIARPEANITGIAADAGIEMQGKHLDLLREAVPTVSRVAYLSPRVEWEGAWGHAILDAGRRVGISIIGLPVEWSADEQQYREAFGRMAQQSADAVMANGFGPNTRHRLLIAELALKYRLPSICWWVDAVKAGELLAYAADLNEIADGLAGQIEKIFKGAKPVDIPIYQPTKFILAINLKTAKALALQIPPALIAQADEVIE